MWAMMEREIESGEKSPSDPIYSKAMRQWSVHQSVMKNPELELVKLKMPNESLKTPAVTTPAPMAPPANATATTGSGASSGKSSDVLQVERLRKSVVRLERMMVRNGWAQPQLPSPLNELHYLKEQMSATHFDINVRETYQPEIQKYLTAARQQAIHSNAPGHLPGLLDGLDALRSTDQPSQLAWTIKETYDFVLRAYLKLLEPPSTVEQTPRKRKREEPPPAPAPEVTITEPKSKEDEDKEEDTAAVVEEGKMEVDDESKQEVVNV